MFKWLEMTRCGAGINRFHTTPVIGDPQSVASHSFGVAMLALFLEPDLATMNLIKAALYHDLAEQVTGDVPAHVKWENPAVKASLLEVEKRFEIEWNLDIKLTQYEQNVLRWADMLELLFYCKEQRMLGNKNMDHIFARGSESLSTLPAHEKGQELLNYLQETYNE